MLKTISGALYIASSQEKTNLFVNNAVAISLPKTIKKAAKIAAQKIKAEK